VYWVTINNQKNLLPGLPRQAQKTRKKIHKHLRRKALPENHEGQPAPRSVIEEIMQRKPCPVPNTTRRILGTISLKFGTHDSSGLGLGRYSATVAAAVTESSVNVQGWFALKQARVPTRGSFSIVSSGRDCGIDAARIASIEFVGGVPGAERRDVDDLRTGTERSLPIS
jgi:hypothetical protein